MAWSKHVGPLGVQPPSDPNAPRLPYGLTVKLAYSMIFPTGAYNTHQLTTPGHNDYFFIPNIAATYLTRPNPLGDGLEVSARLFDDIVAKNPKTDYKTGSVLDLDFAVSERIGRWQAGLAGLYAIQLENDQINGRTVTPNGKRLEAVELGPIANYDIPEWGASIKLKIRIPVYRQNLLNTYQAVLSLGLKLF